MNEAIRIFADSDDDDEVDVRGALPKRFDDIPSIHDVSGELLANNLTTLMRKIERIFVSTSETMESLEIKEVKVAVTVDHSGELSLLGVAKAAVDRRATFEITLTPKSKP